MFVVKRDGRQEPVHFDKITSRINKLSYGLNSEFCDPVRPTHLPTRGTVNARPGVTRAVVVICNFGYRMANATRVCWCKCMLRGRMPGRFCKYYHEERKGRGATEGAWGSHPRQTDIHWNYGVESASTNRRLVAEPAAALEKVTAGVYRGVTTSELDELAAEQAASMTSMHPDYALVCARCAR
eukprot:1003974-Prorocentrum_minimum.AAC.3